MARPTRLNAEYFYHPADFRNDRRVKAIRARLGVAGYGLLLMLLEVLTDADHTWIATDEVELELLAGDLAVEASELEALIQLCEKVGLFRRTPAGMLSCDQLTTWLEPVFEKRNRAKNAAAAPKPPQSVTETGGSVGVSVTETQPVQNSKEQYRKEEKKTESSFDVRASEQVLASPAESKKNLVAANSGGPAPAPAAKPREYAYDEAPIFETKAFFAFLTSIGYGHVDKGLYLLQIQEKGRVKMITTTNERWCDYIRTYLNKDKAAGCLLLPDSTPRPMVYSGAEPTPVTRTKTNYNLAQRAAEQANNNYN